MPLSLIALLLANLVPLAGVLWLDWDAFEVFALYWSESVVVGGYTILQLLTGRTDGGDWRPRDAVTGLFLSVMFCVHYGLFLFVHAFFVCMLLDRGTPAPGSGAALTLLHTAADSAGGLGLWALVLSHGVSFVANFLPRERAAYTRGQLMVRPYVRIVAMHVTLLAGAFLMLAIGSNALLLVLLVVAKVAVDVAAHRREHRRAAAAGAATATAPA